MLYKNVSELVGLQVVVFISGKGRNSNVDFGLVSDLWLDIWYDTVENNEGKSFQELVDINLFEVFGTVVAEQLDVMSQLTGRQEQGDDLSNEDILSHALYGMFYERINTWLVNTKQEDVVAVLKNYLDFVIEDGMVIEVNEGRWYSRSTLCSTGGGYYENSIKFCSVIFILNYYKIYLSIS